MQIPRGLRQLETMRMADMANRFGRRSLQLAGTGTCGQIAERAMELRDTRRPCRSCNNVDERTATARRPGFSREGTRSTPRCRGQNGGGGLRQYSPDCFIKAEVSADRRCRMVVGHIAPPVESGRLPRHHRAAVLFPIECEPFIGRHRQLAACQFRPARREWTAPGRVHPRRVPFRARPARDLIRGVAQLENITPAGLSDAKS